MHSTSAASSRNSPYPTPAANDDATANGAAAPAGTSPTAMQPADAATMQPSTRRSSQRRSLSGTTLRNSSATSRLTATYEASNVTWGSKPTGRNCHGPVNVSVAHARAQPYATT